MRTALHADLLASHQHLVTETDTEISYNEALHEQWRYPFCRQQ
jgi:hypothetical protein